MGKQPLIPLSEIKIKGLEEYVCILSIQIDTACNKHGVLQCTLRLSNDSDPAEDYKGKKSSLN